MTMYKNVHTEHCCAIHGCKYCDDDCTVTVAAKERKYVQSFPCEACCDDGMDTMEKVLKFIHPTMGTFDNHIILYAKHWYGNSYKKGQSDIQHIIDDIRKLSARFYGMYEEHISDMDVRASILDAFDKHVTSGNRLDAMREMLGWKWGRNEGALSDRQPESVMIGQLSIVKGEKVFMPEKYDDVCFDKDKGLDCKKCHRFSIEKDAWNECKCKKP